MMATLRRSGLATSARPAMDGCFSAVTDILPVYTGVASGDGRTGDSRWITRQLRPNTGGIAQIRLDLGSLHRNFGDRSIGDRSIYFTNERISRARSPNCSSAATFSA